MAPDARPHAHFGHDLTLEPVALVGGKPGGIAGAIGEIPEHGESQEDRRDPLEDEQPLPAGEAPRPLEAIHDGAGDRIAEDVRNRDREHEASDDAGPLRRRKPRRQIVDDPGEEARLRDAEEDPGAVVAPWPGDEGREHRHKPPGHHDPGDPGPGPEATQQQIARHLEEEIADVEEAVAEIDDGIGEREVFGHLQPREADVRAVDDVEDIEEREERHEPPRHLGKRPSPDR